MKIRNGNKGSIFPSDVIAPHHVRAALVSRRLSFKGVAKELKVSRSSLRDWVQGGEARGRLYKVLFGECS